MFDILTTTEAENAQTALQTLKDVDWAQPLLSRINSNGGLTKENKPLLFELRYAVSLHAAGIRPDYEWQGVNQTTLDFHFNNQYEWNVELASINTSDVIKNGTKKDGIFSELLLSSDNTDKRLSEEGEILKVQEKILAKVVRRTKGQNTPIKFSTPNEDKKTVNILLIDMRGYLGLAAADKHDYIEIATGHSLIPAEFRHYWFNPQTKTHLPIIGLYEQGNPLTGINILQERIHFIGFICEETYELNEIKDKAFYVYNHHLISEEEANSIFAHYPLKSNIDKKSLAETNQTQENPNE